MNITTQQKQLHHQMWNKMDIKAIKQFIIEINPKLNLRDLESNMFWNDLLDLDYDRAYVAFINCINNIY